ncbi:MAG: hypothetical protein IKX36_10670 [Prevotella sp.]|nr:hypothetical protein [Prevotella sp.]
MKKNEQYKDQGLRLAVQRKTGAGERMTLPDDFTDRLMRRVNQRAPKTKCRHVWLYPVIASVAAIVLLLLMLHGNLRSVEPTMRPVLAQHTEPRDNDPKTEETGKDPVSVQEMPVIAQTAQPAPVAVKKARPVKRAAQTEQKCLAQETSFEMQTGEKDHETTALVPPSLQPHVKPAALSERDIPILHPENYHYTHEELTRMKRRADEAYLRCMEQELETAKQNLKNNTGIVPL